MKSRQPRVVTVYSLLERSWKSYRENILQHTLGVFLFIGVIFLPWYFAGSLLPRVEAIIQLIGGDPETLIACHQISISILIYSVYTALYWLELPIVEKYKTNDVPWPWKVDPEWKRLFTKTVTLFVINQLFIGWLTSQIKLAIFGDQAVLTRLQELPSLPVMVCQVLFFTLCEDFFAFAAHVLLHQPFLYKRIHKVHHEYYNTLVYSYEYSHPLEVIFSDLVAKHAGAVLLAGKAHILTIMVYLILQNLETAECHSGYSFPFAVAPTRHLPFAAPASFHNHHHLINNGNYANTFVIWDAIFGTSINYYEHCDTRRRFKST